MIRLTESDFCWQWDLGRSVEVTGAPTCTSVHFALKGERTSFAVKAEVQSGRLLAEIPNLLLQDGRDIDVWVYDGERTLGCAERIEVKRRAMPSGYIYVPTEVLTVERLKSWVEGELQRLGDYNNLQNKPTLNGVEISGNLTSDDLGITGVAVSSGDIDNMFNW